MMSNLFNSSGRRLTIALLGLVVVTLVITVAFWLYAFRVHPPITKMGQEGVIPLGKGW